MLIEKFQYLTNDKAEFSHEELALKACEGTCKWIQLRTKNQDLETWKKLAGAVKEITDKYNCKLIINDSVEVCKFVNASGVHLGKNDVPPIEARKILGTEKIIGGTANTFEDVQYLIEQKVDYIGYGPYKFTTSKKKLSPLVGIAGYKSLMAEIKKNDIRVPIIAIGGIQLADIEAILKTGISGVAVSGAVHKNNEISKNTQDFIDEIKKFNY